MAARAAAILRAIRRVGAVKADRRTLAGIMPVFRTGVKGRGLRAERLDEPRFHELTLGQEAPGDLDAPGLADPTVVDVGRKLMRRDEAPAE